MANIRLDLDASIYDGQNLTFKAPCDSTNVTGLITYYPNGDSTESTVFTFKDAHGNALDALDLFAEGAYLTVVLDTVNKTCYFKNADTNAYLEGRFAKIESEGASSTKVVEGITVLSSSWIDETDTTALWRYRIENANIKDDMTVGVYFAVTDYTEENPSSLVRATNAGILSATTARLGSVDIYSTSQPDSDLVCSLELNAYKVV